MQITLTNGKQTISGNVSYGAETFTQILPNLLLECECSGADTTEYRKLWEKVKNLEDVDRLAFQNSMLTTLNNLAPSGYYFGLWRGDYGWWLTSLDDSAMCDYCYMDFVPVEYNDEQRLICDGCKRINKLI